MTPAQRVARLFLLVADRGPTPLREVLSALDIGDRQLRRLFEQLREIGIAATVSRDGIVSIPAPDLADQPAGAHDWTAPEPDSEADILRRRLAAEADANRRLRERAERAERKLALLRAGAVA